MYSYLKVEATVHVNRMLLDYHRARQFKIYGSFPLISDDPSLIFTNATITPFKNLFLGDDRPHNYALVQQCLRVGGGAGDPSLALNSPNYSSVFEMFGSGLFGRSLKEAVEYFVDMLTHVGIPFDNLHFTVPKDSPFLGALQELGVKQGKIYSIEENGDFWHAWKFGKNGLLGSGITAVYVPPESDVRSVEDLAAMPDVNIEIGNLIHIYGRDNGGQTESIHNEGFEVGMGSARLAIILERKSLWELSSFFEIFSAVKGSLVRFSSHQVNDGLVRIVTDHLRTISTLIMNGVRPGNKREEFVLRKMIRNYCELVWLEAGQIKGSVSVVYDFIETFMPLEAKRVAETIDNEEAQFRKVLGKGAEMIRKDSNLDPVLLMSTYGIRSQLIPLLK